jgi:hypothetical protein
MNPTNGMPGAHVGKHFGRLLLAVLCTEKWVSFQTFHSMKIEIVSARLHDEDWKNRVSVPTRWIQVSCNKFAFQTFHSMKIEIESARLHDEDWKNRVGVPTRWIQVSCNKFASYTSFFHFSCNRCCADFLKNDKLSNLVGRTKIIKRTATSGGEDEEEIPERVPEGNYFNLLPNVCNLIKSKNPCVVSARVVRWQDEFNFSTYFIIIYIQQAPLCYLP